MKNLSSTSYALLSWLALKPWTTYELARQIRRNLRFFWPRAESGLYEEPKNLVHHGLAKSEKILVGKRAGTLYTITPKGRKALAKWLGTRSDDGVAFECEPLMKVFFGAYGPLEALSAHMDSLLEFAHDLEAVGKTVAEEYLEGRAPFPERIHFSGLIFDFLVGYADNMHRWATAAKQEVAQWKDLDPTGKEERAREKFRVWLRRWEARPDGMRDREDVSAVGSIPPGAKARSGQ